MPRLTAMTTNRAVLEEWLGLPVMFSLETGPSHADRLLRCIMLTVVSKLVTTIVMISLRM